MKYVVEVGGELCMYEVCSGGGDKVCIYEVSMYEECDGGE